MHGQGKKKVPQGDPQKKTGSERYRIVFEMAKILFCSFSPGPNGFIGILTGTPRSTANGANGPIRIRKFAKESDAAA